MMEQKKGLVKTAVQFVKFGIVGVSNTLISLVIYYIGLYFGIYYVISNVLGFFAGTLNAYYWNNKYVFRKEEGEERSTAKSMVKVFVSYGISLGLSTALLVLWVDVVGIHEKIAPLLNLCITIPLNFVMNKFWAFRAEKKAGL